MQEAIQQPTTFTEASDPLAAAAYRAEAWAGEPFLRDGEDPAQALAPGTARRRALDEATAEIGEGKRSPSPQWKVRFGFMLGLERVLAEPEPRTKSGTALRRHQVDALAGMLTELIAASQRDEENGNGHALSADELAEIDEEAADEDDTLVVSTEDADDDEPEELSPEQDPGAIRRYRFRHPTASGKTIAAAGFVEAARTLGVLILTHRRLLVSQFTRDLTTEGYADRFTEAIERGKEPAQTNPLTIQTYAWFARHVDSISRDAYQLVICDEAHTALGEKTSAAIRSFPEPIYIGMTATEQLIAKQVSDVFPASVDDLPLQDAARRGLIAPLRCLRVPPVAAINSVPIVGGDFDQEILAKTLDHQALNQAAASLYRDRFDNTPGIVYAAGVDHAYNLAQEFRAAGIKAEAVSGTHASRPPRRDARVIRARRDQRAHQRAAARRGLELAARDRVHASRADGVAPCLPAARRPHHAHAPAQGSRHRRRLRPEGRDAQRARRVAALAARRRLLPRGRARHTRAAAPFAAACAPPPHAGAVARPGHAGRAQAHRRHPARVAARRPALPRRRRAALLGDDRRPPDPLRRAHVVRAEAHRGAREQGRARAVPRHVRGREPEPPAALDGAAGPRLHAGRACRLRRPRHPRDAGADVGEGAPRRHTRAAARDRGGKARRARPDSRAVDVAARARDAQGAGPARIERVPGGKAAPGCARKLARAPARGERRQARPDRARAADPGRRGAACVGGGLHAAVDEAARRRPRASRRDPRGRARAVGEPAGAEAAVELAQAPQAPQEEGRRRGRDGDCCACGAGTSRA